MTERVSSTADPIHRILWLAGFELRAVLGGALEATGVSLVLPGWLLETGAALPDLVLLGVDGGGAVELRELSHVRPGLSGVPVMRAPRGLDGVEGAALEVLARLLAGATRALAGARPQATMAVSAYADQVQRRSLDEAAARLRCELAELRMTRLVEVSAALSRSATRAEVAAVVLTQGVKALYADTGYVAIQQGDALDLTFLAGFPEEYVERFRRVPLSARLPVVDCFLERRTVIYESPQAMLGRYPGLPSAAWVKTWVFVPMMTDDGAVGVMCQFYLEPTTLGEDDRRYMSLLAQQCALALDRARLYEIERDARKAREEALAIAAHDLRTPLSSVALSAAMLERSLDEKVKSRAGVIRRAAERATDLLRDLLDAAVIEQCGLRLQVEPCDGAALVRELHEMFAPLAEEKRIILEAGCSGEVGAIVIDRARVHQALSNLLGNALKFTPPEGTTAVHLDAQGGRTRFTVRDTGPGIPLEGLPRLFDRYWQARATNRAGVGLGLYIVKGIAEAHGGSVHVDSAPGAGTTFTLTIGG